MKATLFNGKGDVDTWNTGVASAVAQGADAIMLNGMEPALVSGPLAEAERAGIATVYSEHLSDEDRKLGVDASVPQNYYAKAPPSPTMSWPTASAMPRSSW